SPAALTAPTAGSCAMKSMRGLPLAGTQKVAPRVIARALVPPPGATPVSLTVRAAGRPNAPAANCPGQKRPDASVTVDVPVVSEAIGTVSAVTKLASSGGQSGLVFSDPSGVQSWLAFFP